MLITNSTGSSGLAPITPSTDAWRSRQRIGPLTPCRAKTTRHFERSTRTSMKLWKKGAWLKSKIPESVSDETGQLPKRLVQAQAGHFQNGVSESSLPRRASGLG